MNIRMLFLLGLCTPLLYAVDDHNKLMKKMETIQNNIDNLIQEDFSHQKQQLINDLNDQKNEITKQVEQLVKHREKIQLLPNKTEDLTKSSIRFKKQTVRQKKKMCLKDWFCCCAPLCYPCCLPKEKD